MIELQNVSLIYARKTPFERRAIDDLSLKIDEGSFTAIAGHTGSGKSSLVQMISGLIDPTSGKIFVDEIDLATKDRIKARDARRKIGMVFQYPEHQLFEETVELDIAFGAKNFGCDEIETLSRVKASMSLVGLDFEKFRNLAPLELSGGQRRRVAIAGVLALKPKYLILDEPTAGLDPSARKSMLDEISKLHRKKNSTIILISHSMDDIATLADRLIVLSHGKLVGDDSPRTIFGNKKILDQAGLARPRISQLLEKIGIDSDAITIDEGIDAILKTKGRR